MRLVDCQGLAGGMTLGLVQSGAELLYRCGLPFGAKNIEANRDLVGHLWESNYSDNPKDWEDPGDVDVVAGCPPCSGFSSLSDAHHRGINSPVNSCMWDFQQYVSKTRPKIALFESVQQAYSGGRELMQDLHQKLRDETGLDYKLYHVKHNGLAVGGAAIRARYFWLVSRVPFGIELSEPDRVPTVIDSIGDLAKQPLQWEAQEYTSPATWWSESRRSPEGTVDGHITRASIHAQRINDLYETVGEWPGGWDETKMIKATHEKLGRLPESFDRISDKIYRYGIAQGFRNTRRWRTTRPAYVVTGDAANLVFHPSEPRLLTYREIFRIQGFPDNWKLIDLQNDSKIGAYPGKGIPVDCGRWIGGWIKNSLDGNPGSYTGVQLGENEFLIDASQEHKKALKRLLAETEPEASTATVVREYDTVSTP